MARSTLSRQKQRAQKILSFMQAALWQKVPAWTSDGCGERATRRREANDVLEYCENNGRPHSGSSQFNMGSIVLNYAI